LNLPQVLDVVIGDVGGVLRSEIGPKKLETPRRSPAAAGSVRRNTSVSARARAKASSEPAKLSVL